MPSPRLLSAFGPSVLLPKSKILFKGNLIKVIKVIKYG